MRNRDESLKQYEERLLKEVHPTPEALVRAYANMSTVQNMGQPWPEVDHWEQLCESLADAEGMEEEHGDWLADGQRLQAVVRRHGLPLTLESMERAFRKEVK